MEGKRMQPKPVFTTLTTIYTDPLAIISELLKMYYAQPRSHTHVWTENIVSIRHTLARYEKEGPDTLSNVMANELTNALTRIFGEDTVKVEIDTENHDGGFYDMTIKVMGVYEGQPFRMNKSITVDAKGYLTHETEKSSIEDYL